MLKLPSSPRPAPRPGSNGAHGFRYEATEAFAETKAGVDYVMARPALRRLIGTSFFVIMFGFNYVAFYPAMIEGQFGLGKSWVGYISSAGAFGAVFVSVPLAARANSAWAKVVMTAAGLCFGLGVIAFAVAPSFWVAFAVIFFVGGSTTIYQSLSNTLALGMADDAHQGRVQSLMQLSFAGFGIAAFPLGGLAELIGLRPTIVLMGLIAASSALAFAVLQGGWNGLRPKRLVLGASLNDDVDLARSPAAGS